MITRENTNESSVLNEKITVLLNECLAKYVQGEQQIFLKDTAEYARKILEEVRSDKLRIELEIYYGYEKHYLDMLKEYKEEIKFAAALQEDIRKERASFFSERLKDVSSTLKETGVDDKIRSEWINELVKSYTGSLDMSSKLAEEHIVETINEIKQKEQEIIKKVKE